MRKLNTGEKSKIELAKAEHKHFKAAHPEKYKEGRSRILDRIVTAKRIKMNVKLSLLRD